MGIGFGNCDVCSDSGKYKCPGCSTISCSVECVNQHKKLSGCDGLRKKTKYIPLNEFTELDLISDFRILENATSTVDKCRRDKLKRSTRQAVDGFCAPRFPKALKRLQTEAYRSGVKLKILPPHFVRRKANTSNYDFKTKRLYWHVELVLPHISKTISVPSICDKTKMWRLIESLMEPGENSIDLSVSGADLDVYRSVGYGGVQMYMKCESLPNQQDEIRHYYPINMKHSLRYNLRDRVVVEHPVIHVIMKSEECNYRDDSDAFCVSGDIYQQDKERENHEKEGVHSVGMVLGAEENMKADPEAYKQYFDFYLKYYTQKYEHQPPPKTFSIPPPPSQNTQSLPSAFTQFNTFSTPPPNIQSYGQPFSGNHSQPSKFTPPPIRPIPVSSNGTTTAVNKSNLENARKIQAEIREEARSGGLSALAAYDDSDSDE